MHGWIKVTDEDTGQKVMVNVARVLFVKEEKSFSTIHFGDTTLSIKETLSKFDNLLKQKCKR
jgi:hypothetical protein